MLDTVACISIGKKARLIRGRAGILYRANRGAAPLRNHVFSTENNQKLAFSDPPPPLQVIT